MKQTRTTLKTLDMATLPTLQEARVIAHQLNTLVPEVPGAWYENSTSRKGIRQIHICVLATKEALNPVHNWLAANPEIAKFTTAQMHTSVYYGAQGYINVYYRCKQIKPFMRQGDMVTVLRGHCKGMTFKLGGINDRVMTKSCKIKYLHYLLDNKGSAVYLDSCSNLRPATPAEIAHPKAYVSQQDK